MRHTQRDWLLHYALVFRRREIGNCEILLCHMTRTKKEKTRTTRPFPGKTLNPLYRYYYRSRSDKPDNRRRLLHVHRLISNCRYFTRYCFTSIHIVCSRIEVYVRSKQSGMRCGRSGKLRACTQRRWTSLTSADNQTRKNS